MAPEVSVVLTCYNYARYLPAAVESVLGQTRGGWELIIVDDGSTDGTAALLDRWRADPRVRIISQANGGQAKAKNAGIRASTGEFVAFLDADDWWEKAKLEKQLPLFRDPKVGVVYSGMSFVGDDGRPLGAPWDIPGHRGNVLGRLLPDNFVPFSSSVVRRACFDGLGLFDESLPMAIDWDLWLRFALKWDFDCVRDKLLVYRQGHPGQMSGDRTTRFACADRIFEGFLRRHGADLEPADVRRARLYTLNSRGFYYLKKGDALRAWDHLRRSLGMNPFQLWALRWGAVALLKRLLS